MRDLSRMVGLKTICETREF